MKALIRPAVSLFVVLTVVTGVLYPLVVTGVAKAAFPQQAAGSLVVQNGKTVGSSLIGQNFAGETYFHGRPSATSDTDPADSTKTVPAPYNAANSAGSNAGPTAKSLEERVRGDAEKLAAENPGAAVPIDLITTSASGLDPDISPAAALFQVPRVAKVRSLPEDRVRQLVTEHIKGRLLGLLGEPRVNVLQLNLALDATQ